LERGRQELCAALRRRGLEPDLAAAMRDAHGQPAGDERLQALATIHEAQCEAHRLASEAA
jgi:hypothetical protein